MPVWWYPCSRMSCVPASTRAAFVVALALGPVSAVACSAIDCLLHTEIIDQSVTLVKPRVGYLEKTHARWVEVHTISQALQPSGTPIHGRVPSCGASERVAGKVM